MSLSVDNIVKVTVLVAPAAPVARGFGEGMFLGKETILPLWRRVTEYSDTTEVAVDFATNTEAYKASAIWFGQDPKPESFKIGRQFLAAQAGTLRGGTASAVVGDYTGITDGIFDITINGTNRVVDGVNISAATTMAQVAAAVQTGLQVVLASTLCTWDATLKKFIVTSPTTGTSSIVLPAVAGTGTGVDISTLLALTVPAGAKSVNGIAIESLTDALNASAVFDPDFYFVTLTAAASTQDVKDAAAWTESNLREFFYTTNDPNTLTLNDTSNLGYFFKNLSYNRTWGQYSSGSPYAAVSAMARASVVDFDQPNSTITLMFKKEPGIVVESITSGQLAALKSYNLNRLVDYGSFSMIDNGTMANGRFQDEVHGIDWFQANLQNEIFTVMATAPTKIPQTDLGTAKLIEAANRIGEKARNNGLAAKGFWKGDNVGEVKSGDLVPNGYYFTAGLVKDMSQSDKDARKSPPITGILLGAGAIQSADVQVTFQR